MVEIIQTEEQKEEKTGKSKQSLRDPWDTTGRYHESPERERGRKVLEDIMAGSS